MRVTILKDVKGTKLTKIMKRSFKSRNDLARVAKIVKEVKKRGDEVIIRKYKDRGIKNYSLKVTSSEIKNAYTKIDKNFIQATKQAINNIKTVHKAQFVKLKELPTETDKGIFVWREWRPIEKVGLYIPGGKAIYPSSVLMTGIPAIIAGCKEIILCTPPDREGTIPSPTLVAANMIGINKIFKVGGAEAIAAMAYGTQTIPKVYKIFGAGNSYVTEAKMQVFGRVNIDMPAGPSEVFIIADETANPSFIAADLIADGEHGEDSACVLLTTSDKLARQVATEINKQLQKLSTADRVRRSMEKYGLIAVVKTLDEAITFSNNYAPEHLQIMTKNSQVVASKIVNAGSIFLGDWTTKSAGDYATGANHVLPTGGMAKMFTPLSVESFGKMMQIQKITSKKALKKIKKTIETLADVEGLPAHKNSVTIRFKERKNYEKE